MKGSRKLSVEEAHLNTIEKYMLFSDLLDSNGIVEEGVLDKLRLNVRSLLSSGESDPQLIDFCERILFHNDMKAFGLHQLLLLYIEWEKDKLVTLRDTLQTEAES